MRPPLATDTRGAPASDVDISLLVPTRGRVELVGRLVQSLIDTTTDLARIELVLYIDDDDLESQQWADDRMRVIKVVGPAATMGTYNSVCLKASSGRVVVLLNDDVVVRSQDWDTRVLELDRRFDDQVYLGYGDDCLKRHRVSTFPILSRATCDLLREPYDRAYRGALIDYHLFDVFKRLARRGHDRIVFLPDVVVDHLHYRTGRAPFDETYRRRSRFGDDQTFLELRTTRQNLAELLEARINDRPRQDLAEWKRTAQPSPVPMSFRSFWRGFMADPGLPWGWRTFLFTWFCGRHVAAQLEARGHRSGASREERGGAA
jgi:hypothetical protein